MLSVASAVVDWFAGAEILAAVLYLNWLFQPGEAFIVLTCLAAVGLFSAFAGRAASAVFGLAASLCFAVLVLAPFNEPKRISPHMILTVVAFLLSSLALVLLIHRLRKLNAIVIEKKSAYAAPGAPISAIAPGQERGPATESLDSPASLTNAGIDDNLRARISPRHAVAEVARVLWHLRSILAILFLLFVLLSIVMYFAGGAVNAATRTQSSVGETFYFCAITALTVGYGDVVPTTTPGRIIVVLLGLLGVLMAGVTTGSAVYGIQMAAQRAGLLQR